MAANHSVRNGDRAANASVNGRRNGPRGILTERIRLLEKAIAEIEEAIGERKRMSRNFQHEVEKELQEVLAHLRQLPPPWSGGHLVDREFLRLSFHKSATSRKKEKRQEELKLWSDLVQLMEKRRELVIQLKQLHAAAP